MLRIKDCMRTDFLTLDANEGAERVERRMREANVHDVAVFCDGNIVGILSYDDLKSELDLRQLLHISAEDDESADTVLLDPPATSNPELRIA